MEFNIKKNSTLPILKMAVVKDGRNDYQSFMDFIETSSLFFSMVDSDTGVNKIHMEPAGFVEKTFIDPNTPVEYYIYFKFQKKHLNKVGKFEGQFTLRNESGTLILPIREQLFINVLDSQGSEDINESFNLNLTAVISSGSTIINYILTSNTPAKYKTTVDFTHTLQTVTGDTVVITTGVTINSGKKTASVTIVLPDADYNNLTQQNTFSNINIFPIGLRGYTTIKEETIFISPQVQNIIDAILTGVENEYISVGNNFYLKFVDPQIIDDAILADPETYIKVGEGMYLRFIDTPSPSPTNTQTPSTTPTLTPTNTVTPTVTSSEVPIETPTPTPTITPTISIACDSFTFTGVNATTTINSAIKTTGGGWNSSAYSVETYTNPVYVTFNMSNTNIGAMGGFSVNPTFSESTYENATFGLYGENGVNLKIYENGNNVYTVFEGGNITPSDLFKVEYDGTVVNYYYNGSLVYTSLQTITQPLHIFFPLLTENEGVTNVCVIETPLPTPTETPTPTVTPTNISCLNIETNAGGGLDGFSVGGQAVAFTILSNPAVGTTYPVGSFITFQNGEVRTLVGIDDYGAQYDVFYDSPISSATLFPITICYPSIPTPTPTSTSTQTPTPTTTVTPTLPKYYYLTNTYDCVNCQLLIPAVIIVFSHIPLTIGKFYQLQTSSFEILSVSAGPETNNFFNLTDSIGYDTCNESCGI